MSGSDSVTVEVSVTLGAALEAVATEGEVAGRLQGYLDDLVDDLRIPASVTLRLNGAGDLPPTAYRVSIAGRNCRLAQPAALGSREVAPWDLAFRLARASLANRDLLLDSEVVNAFWRQRARRAGECPRPVVALLSGLVRHALNLERGLAFCRSPDVDVDSFPEVLEEVICEASGPVQLVVGGGNLSALQSMISGSDGGGETPSSLAALADALFEDLGIIGALGGLEADPEIEPGTHHFRVNDLRTPPRVGATDRQALLEDWGDVARQHADILFSSEVLDFCLSRLGEYFPDLVAETRRSVDRLQLTRILRSLLREQVRIRDLRAILEGLLGFRGSTDVDVTNLIPLLPDAGVVVPEVVAASEAERAELVRAECARLAVKEQITFACSRGARKLGVLLVGVEIEQRMADPTPYGAAERAALIGAMSRAVDVGLAHGAAPVVVTNGSIRQRLRRELELEYPRIPVISYQEVAAGTSLVPVGRISLAP